MRASVDPEGRIVLPPEIVSRYGLRPGAEIFIDEAANGLRLGLPVNHLAKVYIEPTNRCNLECRTCMRNEWSEPLGQMDRETFGHILESLRVFSPLPKVFLGGLGEPLFHPEIVEMVAGVNLNVAKKILKTSPPPFPPPSEGEGQGGGAKSTGSEVL